MAAAYNASARREGAPISPSRSRCCALIFSRKLSLACLAASSTTRRRVLPTDSYLADEKILLTFP